ncbi:MAG: serine/threonine protein kinase, partial [Planctomycetes bacterium]|nr:serine/threonine protein kinase [Planctomycetota bacterium]
MTSSTGDSGPSRDLDTRDGELLADLFDDLLQEILEGRTPDLAGYLPDRPDLRERVARTWALACSVAGRREASKPVLGGYEILRELGHGGMGTVYLARHDILQRDVAIKVLPHSLAMSPRAKQRFLQEAKSLARIRHDHVVHIHRVLDHTEMLAFEMEYVDGPSLQQVLQELRAGRRPALLGDGNPVEWCVRTCIDVARALDEVHRHGLIHRDIKPSNILLRRNGTPVVADFGLACLGEL